MEACLRAVRGGVPQARTCSTAGCRTRCCSRCSPTRASAPWCPVAGRRVRRDAATPAGPLGTAVDDGHLRHARRRAGPGPGLPRLGRRRDGLPRPPRRASPSTALGHAHPAVVEAVSRADRRRSPTPPTSTSTSRRCELAERLRALSLGGRRREGLLLPTPARRPTRPRSRSPAGTGRTDARRGAEGAFHGRTLGALALTGQPAKRAPFEPLPARRARSCPYGDAAALRAAVGPTDRGGVPRAVARRGRASSPPPGRLPGRRARDLHAAGALLVARRGPERDRPHRPLVRAASDAGRAARRRHRSPRASAAGCRSAPASASAGRATLLRPGDHGSTFGGNPVAVRRPPSPCST